MSAVSDFIEFQHAPPEYEEEVIERLHEKRRDTYVVKAATIKQMLRKMEKYGHIEWLENALRDRMEQELGERELGTSGPRAPVPGDIKTYSVILDHRGRRFVRIPTCSLELETGDKVIAEFKKNSIALRAKKEIEV